MMIGLDKQARGLVGNVLFLAGLAVMLAGLWNIHASAALIVGGAAASWAGYRVFVSTR